MGGAETREVFAVILDLGATLLRSGAEVYRVEDTLTRLIQAYGGTESNVFAIPTHIVVTAKFNGTELSSARRVPAPGMNLEVVDRVNALARHACKEKPGAKEFRERLKEAEAFKGYNAIQRILIFALIGGSFTLLFGGSFEDAAVSSIIGIILFFVMAFSRGVSRNTLFTNAFCAAIAAFLAVIAVRNGMGHDADKIIIGNIMLLIPGVELVNGMRDFIASDIQAGIMHITEALFLAIGIAVGAAGMLTLLGGVA